VKSIEAQLQKGPKRSAKTDAEDEGAEETREEAA
jgi:hypothetical protein